MLELIFFKLLNLTYLFFILSCNEFLKKQEKIGNYGKRLTKKEFRAMES